MEEEIILCECWIFVWNSFPVYATRKCNSNASFVPQLTVNRIDYVNLTSARWISGWPQVKKWTVLKKRQVFQCYTLDAKFDFSRCKTFLCKKKYFGKNLLACRMWPMKLDMTRDECRGVLRRLGKNCASDGRASFQCAILGTSFFSASMLIFALPSKIISWFCLPLPRRVGVLFECYEYLSCAGWPLQGKSANSGWPAEVVAYFAGSTQSGSPAGG